MYVVILNIHVRACIGDDRYRLQTYNVTVQCFGNFKFDDFCKLANSPN